MKIYEIGTGYTSIPARMGAATEIVVEELTKSLQADGQAVTLIDIKDPHRLPNDLPIVEVKVSSIFTKTDVALGIMHKLKRVAYSLALAKKLKKLVKEDPDDVVLHFHNQYNLFFFLKRTSAALRSKVKIAYTVHSYIWHGDWSDIGETVKNRYFQEIAAMKAADVVYVLNERTRENIRDHVGIDEKKLCLIDNGVNTDVYHPLTEQAIREVKTGLGLDGKKIFIQIGSVCDRKNQLGALELLLPLMEQDKDIAYVYAGGIIDQPYQDQIVAFAQAHGLVDRVRYLGEVAPGKELNAYYSMAEAMLFPSKQEGFSLVVIEAMSAGTPVIVHERLQFRLSDRCLTYSDQASFEAMVEHQILDQEKQKMNASAARASVLEAYSWNKVARDYLDTIALCR